MHNFFAVVVENFKNFIRLESVNHNKSINCVEICMILFLLCNSKYPQVKSNLYPKINKYIDGTSNSIRLLICTKVALYEYKV